MQELKIFENEQFGKVRTLQIEKEPYFIAIDVCNILGLTNPTVAISRLDEDEVTKFNLGGLSGETNIVNEYGLYNLILASRKKEAKAFKRWITHEVIPSIRKHGLYATDELLDNPDFLIEAITKLKEEREKNLKLQAINSKLEVENEIMQPKAEYFDELVSRNLLTNFRDTAKMLQIKENVFIKFLLNKKYIYRDKKGKLVPYAYKNTGLFEVKETLNHKTEWKGTQTLITPLGREHFRVLVAGLKSE
ncbi:MAG: phage antirepressor KilAC domain-containing protein [Parvimonas sp.]|nr:phage antirepressor KilAC domain-containing protein [Parvimonas sp.]